MSISTNTVAIENRIERSVTRIFKAVFPGTTNHYDTLFGGTALALMDETAFITATRFCRQEVVTISTDRIDFTKPIPAGTIIELVGKVVRVGRTSLDVEVEVFLEYMHNEHRERAIKGMFKFVALDQHRKPTPVLQEKSA